MTEQVLTRYGTAVCAFLLHDVPHPDGTYCVVISIVNQGDFGTRSNVVRSSLTVEEVLDAVENAGKSPGLG